MLIIWSVNHKQIEKVQYDSQNTLWQTSCKVSSHSDTRIPRNTLLLLNHGSQLMLKQDHSPWSGCEVPIGWTSHDSSCYWPTRIQDEHDLHCCPEGAEHREGGLSQAGVLQRQTGDSECSASRFHMLHHQASPSYSKHRLLPVPEVLSCAQQATDWPAFWRHNCFNYVDCVLVFTLYVLKKNMIYSKLHSWYWVSFCEHFNAKLKDTITVRDRVTCTYC